MDTKWKISRTLYTDPPYTDSTCALCGAFVCEGEESVSNGLKVGLFPMRLTTIAAMNEHRNAGGSSPMILKNSSPYGFGA